MRAKTILQTKTKTKIERVGLKNMPCLRKLHILKYLGFSVKFAQPYMKFWVKIWFRIWISYYKYLDLLNFTLLIEITNKGINIKSCYLDLWIHPINYPSNTLHLWFKSFMEIRNISLWQWQSQTPFTLSTVKIVMLYNVRESNSKLWEMSIDKDGISY